MTTPRTCHARDRDHISSIFGRAPGEEAPDVLWDRSQNSVGYRELPFFYEVLRIEKPQWIFNSGVARSGVLSSVGFFREIFEGGRDCCPLIHLGEVVTMSYVGRGDGGTGCDWMEPFLASHRS